MSITYQKLKDIVDISKFNNSDDYYLVTSGITSKIVKESYMREIEKDNYKFNCVITSDVVLMRKAHIQEIARYGFLMSDHYHKYEGTTMAKPRADAVSKDIAKDLNNPEFEFVQILDRPLHLMMIKTLNGSVLHEPIQLDGNYAHLNDAKYKLDEFVEHLSKRDDLSFITHFGQWSRDKVGMLNCPIKGTEPNIGGVIQDYEHHLEEGESAPDEKECVLICYRPKSEDLKKIIEWETSNSRYDDDSRKRAIYNYQDFIVRDILGGEAFRIKPEMVEEGPKRKFKH